MSKTIWYRINHPDYSHCNPAITLVSVGDGVTDLQAAKIAACLAAELRWVTRLDAEVEAWVD